MTENNLLSDAFIHVTPVGLLTLPATLAALTRDEVDSFPALRPHQAPAWHMFLVQLASLSLLRCRFDDIPLDEHRWKEALRSLTLDFPEDEPWRLIWDDWSKPAFLQPPVPKGVMLKNSVRSPDALDLLITAKNHDLKQAVGRNAHLEDWIFALVSLQTGEGYGGSGNQGIARMNGGSSSRAMVTLAPLPNDSEKSMTPRLGARFQRDVTLLVETREKEHKRHEHLCYPQSGGLGLVWLAPWPEGKQLQLKELDIWFIEACRRVRLRRDGETVIAHRGTSKSTRINAKPLKGKLGDPFTPVHKTDAKSLTLGGGNFNYHMLTDLMLSGNWELPVLACMGPADQAGSTMVLVAQALSRGNSKTEGFKSRTLPLGGEIARTLGSQRKQLHELASKQMEEINAFDKAIARGLACVAARGDSEKIKKEHYVFAKEARNRFDQAVDRLFFDHLWNRFKAEKQSIEALNVAKATFARTLFKDAKLIFEAALPAIPCASIFRSRAETRARNVFFGKIRHNFPEVFENAHKKETVHEN